MNAESVSTSTYQPRIKVSISKPQVDSTSADHWKRKLRIENEARMARQPLAPRLVFTP